VSRSHRETYGQDHGGRFTVSDVNLQVTNFPRGWKGFSLESPSPAALSRQDRSRDSRRGQIGHGRLAGDPPDGILLYPRSIRPPCKATDRFAAPGRPPTAGGCRVRRCRWHGREHAFTIARPRSIHPYAPGVFGGLCRAISQPRIHGAAPGRIRSMEGYGRIETMQAQHGAHVTRIRFAIGRETLDASTVASGASIKAGARPRGSDVGEELLCGPFAPRIRTSMCREKIHLFEHSAMFGFA
jgi:hypothetical protein